MAALEAGASLVPFTILMLLLSSQAGQLAQRIGPRLPMTVGPIVAALGLLLMSRVEPGVSYGVTVLPAVVVFGLGLTLTVAPLTAAVLAATSPRAPVQQVEATLRLIVRPPLHRAGAMARCRAMSVTRTARRHRLAGGRVRLATTTPVGTELEFADTEGRVAVAARPDPVAADLVVRALDRVLWQRLDVGAGAVSGLVLGVRHRRPVHLHVAGSAALGLLEAGVPTIAALGPARP